MVLRTATRASLLLIDMVFLHSHNSARRKVSTETSSIWVRRPIASVSIDERHIDDN
jgi:hypothetical protein